MFKKRAKTNKHVTVYRPSVLSATEHSTTVAKPIAVSRPSRRIPGMTEDILIIVVLGLAIALVVMAGTISQSTVSHSHMLASIYDPNILTRPLANKPKTQSNKRHAHREIPVIVAPPPPELGITCSGRTVMNIVAHQDDDLLFINPDISHDLAQHDCVRTVYVTAGDDGRGADYLRQREAGSRAAYGVMLHTTRPWYYEPIKLASGATVATISPQDNTNVSLVFLRLPDGNLNGEGFPSTGHQSIARLKAGAINEITTVDSKQTYTSSQLVNTLDALIEQYQPVRINTQAEDGNLAVADHSDHLATGEYVALAAAAYAEQSHHQVVVRRFMGYPIRAMLPNLPATDIAQKSAAFFAYAVDDPGVCTSMQICTQTRSTYGLYLQRQYVAAGQ